MQLHIDVKYNVSYTWQPNVPYDITIQCHVATMVTMPC